jgi:hypothetical protein
LINSPRAFRLGRLSVSRGFIYFGKDAPFQPRLDLQAESTLRDYLIHAYIFGPASDPQVQLSSEPPLPHADIVALLATGITTSELAGNPNALAGRAALLALKELYRKTFKKGATPEPDEDEENLLDRLNSTPAAPTPDRPAGGERAVQSDRQDLHHWRCRRGRRVHGTREVSPSFSLMAISPAPHLPCRKFRLCTMDRTAHLRAAAGFRRADGAGAELPRRVIPQAEADAASTRRVRFRRSCGV